jgi:hypothetical protein
LFKIRETLPHPYYRTLESFSVELPSQVKFKDETTTLRKIETGVPQGNALLPFLYLIYTSDLPTAGNTTAFTFAADTAILATHGESTIASVKLQATISKINNWAKKWRIKINQINTLHSPCAMKPFQGCKWAMMLSPPKTEVECLGMYIDRRLTWAKHIKTKRNQLNLKVKRMHCLLGRRSTRLTESKLPLYKAVLKLI